MKKAVIGFLLGLSLFKPLEILVGRGINIVRASNQIYNSRHLEVELPYGTKLQNIAKAETEGTWMEKYWRVYKDYVISSYYGRYYGLNEMIGNKGEVLAFTPYKLPDVNGNGMIDGCGPKGNISVKPSSLETRIKEEK